MDLFIAAMTNDQGKASRGCIVSNDLKKGAQLVMRGTGWTATMADNARGNIRMATVEGHYTETGSIYVWDIEHAIIDGQRVPIALTPQQIKARAAIKAAGW